MKNAVLNIIFALIAFQAGGQGDYTANPVNKLNSAYNDFAATPWKNGVVFCSNKKNDLIISYLNESNDAPLTQLYFAEKKEDGKFTSARPIELSDKIKSDIGPLSFAGEHNVYYTKSYQGKKGMVLGIFSARLNEDFNFDEPVQFVHNNASYQVAHPSVNHDGTRIYFSANLPGGFGKADIYYCDLIQGKWGNPVNAGPKINSSESELFPFIHPDGTLFFSSDRSGGLGKMDIYQHSGEETSVLLASPFNSPADDYAYHASADYSSGYFSSNRNGNDDIFAFELEKPRFENCDTLQPNSYCYLFYDAATMDLDSFPLQYEWNLGDGTRIRGLEAEHCYEKPGLYEVSLSIVDTLTGDLFFSQANYSLQVEDIQQVYIDSPDTVETNLAFDLNGLKTNLNNFVPASYHWYFSDGYYAEGEEINHLIMDSGMHQVTLGVRSKPDQRGVVKNACVTKPFYVSAKPLENQIKLSEPELVTAKSEPDDRSQVNNVFSYLKANRDSVELSDKIAETAIFRVEILKTKERLSTLDDFFDEVREAYDVVENYVPEDSLFSYAVGAEDKVCNTYPIYSYVKSLNYHDASVKAYIPDHVYNLDDMEQISVEDLNRVVFRTGAIYFETGEATLKDEATHTIEKIFKLMSDYPEIKIVIGAHTDNVGTADFNMNLSQYRAASVINRLVEMGIDQKRLVGVGYGAELPIASNEAEEGRRLNRRVEFKVVDYLMSKK